MGSRGHPIFREHNKIWAYFLMRKLLEVAVCCVFVRSRAPPFFFPLTAHFLFIDLLLTGGRVGRWHPLRGESWDSTRCRRTACGRCAPDQRFPHHAHTLQPFREARKCVCVCTAQSGVPVMLLLPYSILSFSSMRHEKKEKGDTLSASSCMCVCVY